MVGSSNSPIRITYNRQDRREAVKKKRTQYRGTAQISRHAAALRMIEQGTDPEGLGRWCWQLYRGKTIACSE
jgi:hypothetical protein